MGTVSEFPTRGIPVGNLGYMRCEIRSFQLCTYYLLLDFSIYLYSSHIATSKSMLDDGQSYNKFLQHLSKLL